MVRGSIDGLGCGVGGYVMVFGRESLEGEGELLWSKGGWGVVLLDICRDWRGRDGVGVRCRRVKLRSLEWDWGVEVGGLR